MRIYLGIDVGTQSVKTVCYSATEGRIVANASAPLPLIDESDGTREQLAQWWIQALIQCLKHIGDDIKQRVVAIGVSGQQHGFVPLGKNGSVLAPVKLWCDTATTRECAQITEAFGGKDKCIEELGNQIVTGFTAPKIRWLKNHRPEDYAQLDTVLLPHDYVNFYLTGERTMEYGDASGTGLMDVRRRCWHAGILKAIDPDRDLSHCLPRLIGPKEQAGCLKADVARELGLPEGVSVSSGGGDNMMAAIGTGNVAPGRLTISLGTSGTLFATTDKPIVDPTANMAAFCSSSGGWLPLWCTMNCTVATELTRGLFDIAVGELDRRVSGVAIGADGVMTLPFYQGERTPNLPAGKGCIFGLDANNMTPDHLLRSAMESAIFGLRVGLDSLVTLGCEASEIRLTGGGAKSAVWRQMVSDIFNLPVSILEQDEGAALGAALQALWMDSDEDNLTRLVDQHLKIDAERSCRPDPVAVEQYRPIYQEYLRHVEQVTPLYELKTLNN